MMEADPRIAVAVSLGRKLPERLVEHARPIDERCELSLALSFEPWIAYARAGQRLELHIVDGATAKIVVYDGSIESNPVVSHFLREDSGLEGFTDTLARELRAIAR